MKNNTEKKSAGEQMAELNQEWINNEISSMYYEAEANIRKFLHHLYFQSLNELSLDYNIEHFYISYGIVKTISKGCIGGKMRERALITLEHVKFFEKTFEVHSIRQLFEIKMKELEKQNT